MQDDRDDDERNRLAFTAETDFTDGKWMGGEFFASGQRRGRRQTRDEAIYGVFAGDDSDDDDLGGVGSARGRSGKLPAAAAPVQFVSGGVKKGEETKPKSSTPAPAPSASTKGPAASKTNADFERLVRGARQGLGAHVSEENVEDGSGAGKGRREAGPERPARVQPVLPNPSMDQGFAQFEQHTKGFGMKYLKKFNYRGRLGKYESGTTSFVRVKPRKGREAIGFGGQSEMVKENAELEYLHNGRIIEGSSMEAAVQQSRPSLVDEWAEEAWRTGGDGDVQREGDDGEQRVTARKDGGTSAAPQEEHGRRRRKPVFRTAAEIVADASNDDGQQGAILDMRGPQVRVLNDLSDIGKVPPSALDADGKPRLGEELLHNVGSVCDLAESDLVEAARQVRHAEERLVAAKEELRELSGYDESQGAGAAEAAVVSSAVERCVAAARSTEVSSVGGPWPRVAATVEALEELPEQVPSSFRMLELGALGPAVLDEALSADIHASHWDVWDASQLEALAGWMDRAAWAVVGTSRQRRQAEGRPTTSSPLQVPPREPRSRAHLRALLGLVEDRVVSRVRMALLREWDPRSEVSSAVVLRICRALDACASRETIQQLEAQCIAPAVLRAVEAWDPTEDPRAPDAWVLPWRPRLGHLLDQCLTVLRRKFADTLRVWHPSDGSADTVLRPWKDVFDAKVWDTLLLQHVMPKLVVVLRELPINPQAQELAPFRWVMRWADLVPRFHMACLLEGEFFPQWLRVLQAWLEADPNFEDIVAWYTGWKEEIPASLQEHPIVQGQLRLALQGMANVPEGKPFPSQTSSGGYEASLARHRRHTGTAKAPSRTAGGSAPAPVPARKSKPALTAGLSVRDVLGSVAAKHNIEFVPHPKHARFQGKPLFRFGPVSVYVERQVVFAESPTEPGVYHPTSLDELLRRAL